MSSEAELDTAPKAERDVEEKVESFLCRSLLLHDGHSGAGDELRTSFSNSLPQEPHLYSKMGMMVVSQVDGRRSVYDQTRRQGIPRMAATTLSGIALRRCRQVRLCAQ